MSELAYEYIKVGDEAALAAPTVSVRYAKARW
jgi:hypothetical protein